MKKKSVFYILVLLFSVLGIEKIQAQSQTTFGKNRVQLKNFEWKYLSTANFDVYFYGNNEELATMTAHYAEMEFKKITDILGFFPFDRVKIFAYQSISDLQQSNMGVSYQDYALGGQTNFAKNVVEVAFTGDRVSFRQDIVFEITDALLLDMMYGGNLKEILQNSFLLNLSDWFVAGVSAYTAYGWDTRMDDFVRANLDSWRLKHPDSFTGIEAQILGQSIWNYIEKEYGKNAISNVLNISRILRNERSAIENAFGMSYQEFISNWIAFYQKDYDGLAATHKKLSPDNVFTSPKTTSFYKQARLSPDGNYIAFAEVQQGFYKVFIQHIATGKKKKVLKGGLYVINQKTDKNLPLLQWKDDKTLAIIHVKNDKHELTLCQIEGKSAQNLNFSFFQNIHSFEFSEDGNEMIVSAEKNGTVDIYTYSFRSATIKQITKDSFDDITPCFVDSKRFIFASNRSNDTTATGLYHQNIPVFNLFLYDTHTQQLKMLTKHQGISYFPQVVDKENITFLSDQRGVVHLFNYNLKTEVENQITNYTQDLLEYDFVAKKWIGIMRSRLEKQVVLINDFNFKQENFSDKNLRKNVADLEAQKARQEGKNTISNQTTSKENAERNTNSQDSTQNDEAGGNYRFDTFGKKDNKKNKKKDDDFVVVALNDYDPKKLKLSRPSQYENRFGLDQSITGFSFDPIRSFGLFLSTSTTDDLENHKLNFGLFNPSLFNTQNGIMYAEYKYLKSRIDYTLRFDRQSIAFFRSFFTHRYSLSKIEVNAAYPLSVTTRISAAPFIANTAFIPTSENNPAVQQYPRSSITYSGFNTEFVYDNTVITGVNMRRGAQLKGRFEQYIGISKKGTNFSILNIEGRYYKQILRTFTFASRIAYGKYFSGGNKIFRLGGVNNWLNRRDDLTEKDPFYVDDNDPDAFKKDLSDLLFMQYVMPLRGFNYNKMYGSNYMLINLELRLPVMDKFYQRTVKSNFLRNLQLIGFIDIGSAWTGISPFNKENALNTDEIEVGPFYAKVSNFKDPFLVGYGGGVRTRVLGFFTKFDVAWGIEDGLPTNTKYYFSLGFDF